AGGPGGGGADVARVGRTPERGAVAAGAIRDATGNRRVTLTVCDVGEPRDVRTCCETLRAGDRRIDVLVNNAGIYAPRRHLTPAGREQMLAVNHLGPFLMTNLLLDRLDGRGFIRPPRAAHVRAKGALTPPAAAPPFPAFRQYGAPKPPNTLFPRGRARRGRDRGIVATCFHPGAVGSEFGQDDPGLMRF